MDKARGELFSHVIRCEVLEATMSHRVEWLEETIDYMAYRHPHLSKKQLDRLETLGRRFIKPAIPHGAKATHLNREAWQDTPVSEQEFAGAPA